MFEQSDIPERDMALIEQVVSTFRDRLIHVYTVAHIEGQIAAKQEAIGKLREEAA